MSRTHYDKVIISLLSYAYPEDELMASFQSLYRAQEKQECWSDIDTKKTKKRWTFKTKKRTSQSSLLDKLKDFYSLYKCRLETEGVRSPIFDALRLELASSSCRRATPRGRGGMGEPPPWDCHTGDTPYTSIYDWLLLRVFPFLPWDSSPGEEEVKSPDPALDVDSEVSTLSSHSLCFVEQPLTKDQQLREIRKFFWCDQLTLLEMYHFLKKYHKKPLKVHGKDDYPSILKQFGLYMFACEYGLPTKAYGKGEGMNVLYHHFLQVKKLMLGECSQNTWIKVFENHILENIDDHYSKYTIPFEREASPSETNSNIYKALGATGD